MVVYAKPKVPKTQSTDAKLDRSMLDQVVDVCADVPSSVATAKTVNETLGFAKVYTLRRGFFKK